MAQYLMYVLNAKGTKLPSPTHVDMRVPPSPSLRNLLEWTPDELKTFLEECEGDLAGTEGRSGGGGLCSMCCEGVYYCQY